MARYSDTLVNQYGAPIGGALVTVVHSATGLVASLTSDGGSGINNPFQTNADGSYYFNTDGDFYDLTFRYGGRVIGENLNVNIGAVGNLPAGSVVNLLDALNTASDKAPAQGPTLFNINPIRYYGYRGDGVSHPLSSITYCQGQNTTGWSLTQWQTLFPRATALTDQIDNHAIQRWCDLNPNRVEIDIPAGIGLIDKGIVTGDNQAVFITGSGHDISFLRAITPGITLWTHGYAGHLANGTFNVCEMSIRTNVIAACAFNVWFSGNQTPWCHLMRNVIFQAENSGQYFQNACITRNIKRGLDWRNVVAYGAYGALLSTDAFWFPANTDQTTAGNSYNFDNCMTVGYRYGWMFDSVGFTSSSLHCHEEATLYNCQAYAGVGMFQYLNTNTNVAPDDNWIFINPGYQGTGPAFNMQRLEQIYITAGLFVNDTVTTATDCFGRFVDCDDAWYFRNEIFCVTGSNITGFRLSGSNTYNFRFTDNNVIAYASLQQMFYFDSTLPDMGVIERGTSMRGTATYANGYVNDQGGSSKGQVSELRVAQAVLAMPGVNPPTVGYSSWDVLPNGDIVFEGSWTTSNNDSNGNVQLNWPGSLFKIGIKAFVASNINVVTTTISPASSPTASLTGAVVRYAGLAANTPNLGTRLRIIGR